MVLAGEFSKWFTTNFAASSQEEEDFQANKEEMWVSTVQLAMRVDSLYPTVEHKVVIMTDQWWSRTRFADFGVKFAAKLTQNPSLKKELRSKFTKHGLISYYDFFHFIEQDMGIKLECWEEDALEGRLDRLGMAFIEFNELNEFSLMYDFSWGEPLLQNDLESQMDAKINQSYKDYTVTEADYF